MTPTHRSTGGTSRPGRLAVLAVLGCFSAAGCVYPGRIDEGLISRYQESVLRRSPQLRAGPRGTALLRPAAPAAAPDTVKDALTGAEAIELSLDEAVRMALSNSMDIRVISFDPAISREDMVRAAAEFDYVVFGSFTQSWGDRHSPTILVGSQTQETPMEIGVRKKTVYGASLEWKWNVTRIADNSPFTTPNPFYDSTTSLSLTQPLLRNAGKDFNLAALEVARIGHGISYSQFRQTVEQIVSDVQATYWTLAQTRRDLEIQIDLLEKTEQTYERVKWRRELDATDVEVKQAESAVQTRRADLLRARKTLFDVQDRLARLLVDARINTLGRYVLIPTTPPVTSEVNIDPAEQLVLALRHSPLLEQARLAIATADVRVSVAENETLPELNLVAGTSLQGLAGDAGGAIDDMSRFNFIDYTIGATFEYPLGNRAAIATLRQQRLQRLKSITELQNTADLVAVNVNEAVRQIYTSFQEVEARDLAVEAARAQLNALEETERIRAKLTPEFLQLKLTSQEILASTEREQIRAAVEFNVALARLAQVTGTSLQQHNIKLAAESAMSPPP